MYVYFIRARGKPQRLKIGKAADPERRLKELQTGCPYPLQMEAKIRCKSDSDALRIEKLAHEYFCKERTQGEWFKCTDYLLSRVWGFVYALPEERRS